MTAAPRLITGYLIDPIAATISEATLDGDDFTQIHRLIDAKCFDVARLSRGDGIFVDDEGLLIVQHPDNFFLCALYPEPLAGKGLVLGCDAEGNSVSPAVSFEELFQRTLALTDLGGNNWITRSMKKGPPVNLL